jgi:hypothetical protein
LTPNIDDAGGEDHANALMVGKARELPMAEKMTVHLFKCAQENASYRIYGLTTDKTGKNLPPMECPTGWVFDKTETVTEGEIVARDPVRR